MAWAADDGVSAGGPSIGVVIAAFNAERFLDLTLSSIFHQTRRPEQIVVVDDCSTDTTAEVARRWEDRLPVTVISLSENAGPGQSRRTGIAQLTTEYVAVLDADDVWMPEHLELTSARIAPDKVVVPLYQIWVEGVGLAGVFGSRRRRRKAERATDQLPMLIRENFVTAGSTFNRNFYHSVGGYPPTRFAEDHELWVKFALAGARFEFLDAATVLYRRHPGGMAMVSSQAERSKLESINRIAEMTPPSMKRHSRHARRVSEARILLCVEREQSPMTRRAQLGLLAPVFVRAPFRQKVSAMARVVT